LSDYCGESLGSLRCAYIPSLVGVNYHPRMSSYMMTTMFNAMSGTEENDAALALNFYIYYTSYNHDGSSTQLLMSVRTALMRLISRSLTLLPCATAIIEGSWNWMGLDIWLIVFVDHPTIFLDSRSVYIYSS
jgi:hypothetical protein